MKKFSSNFIAIFSVIAFQIIIILPAIILSYTVLTPHIELENLLNHYIFSGVLGLSIGFASIVFIKKNFNISTKAINYHGASAGLFGMLAVLYSSWTISPVGSWPYETIVASSLNPGSPLNAWIGSFVYYMLFNIPFVYLYFDEKEGTGETK